MEKSFVRLAALVTNEQKHRPSALIEARSLLARIGTGADPANIAVVEMASDVGIDIEIWFGPHKWDGGMDAMASAKADLLADLLKLEAALVRTRH